MHTLVHTPGSAFATRCVDRSLGLQPADCFDLVLTGDIEGVEVRLARPVQAARSKRSGQ